MEKIMEIRNKIAGFWSEYEIYLNFLVKFVVALSLFPGALNSIQIAYIAKRMLFQKLFYSSTGSAVISGVIGIILAYRGWGIWALVVQNVIGRLSTAVIFWIVLEWHPTKVFELQRAKGLISFGWKLLVSSLIENIYNNLYGLIIGKIYNSTALGLYNKGNQIPSIVQQNVNTTINAVIFPALSEYQDSQQKLKDLTRKTISLTAYIVFPIMIGMAVIARPLTLILLTEKWEASIIYMQIGCLACMFMPISTANLQAINAIGRSDIYLKLELIKKIPAILLLVIFVPIGVEAMAFSLVLVSIINLILNAWPNRKLLNYKIKEQVWDLLPILLISGTMGIITILLTRNMMVNNWLLLCIRTGLGVIIYMALSFIFRLKEFRVCMEYLKGFAGKFRRKEVEGEQ